MLTTEKGSGKRPNQLWTDFLQQKHVTLLMLKVITLSCQLIIELFNVWFRSKIVT